MENAGYQPILDAGAAVVKERFIQGTPFVVVPDGYHVHTLEKHLPAPLRKTGNIQLSDVESFGRYIERHKDGRTVIFMSPQSLFVCVFDHHGDDEAGWGQHRATFSPMATEEWKRWSSANKKRMSQKEFAEFIEENVRQIVSPSGALMLEVASRLEATTSVDFVSGVRLDNGNAQFRYEETTEAKVGAKGEMQVPQTFKLGMQIFEGGEAYSIDARLRYRIEEKHLQLWYELVTPHLIVKDAIDGLAKTVMAITAIKPLLGQAPTAN